MTDWRLLTNPPHLAQPLTLFTFLVLLKDTGMLDKWIGAKISIFEASG